MNRIPLTCLVVDDSEADRFALRRTLLKLQPALSVKMASSIAEARRCLAGDGAHFIILDNSLPDGNGADFVMEMARSPKTAALPVLIVTGWPSPFLFAKAREAKVWHVLSKDQLRGDATLSLLRECMAAAAAQLRSETVAQDTQMLQPVSEKQRARMAREH